VTNSPIDWPWLLRGWCCGAVLLGQLTLCGGCAGVEAEVLSLRDTSDLASSDGQMGSQLDLADPAGPVCTAQTLSMAFCIDLLGWRKQAEAVCRMYGARVGRFQPDKLCGPGLAKALFDCCEQVPVPVCAARIQGDGLLCQDAAIWQASAALDCQSRGERVESVSTTTACSENGFRYVKYLCCKPSGASAGLQVVTTDN
jgi:Copper-binding of amyloid precursor, CuBD